jgi:hypothetical protein
MEIEWYAGGCVRVRGAAATIMFDPDDRDERWLGDIAVDIAAFSHHPTDDDATVACGTVPFSVHGPGEYEVHGIFVTGVRMSDAATDGVGGAGTTAYNVLIDELTVCHLGNLAHLPTQEQVDALGGVDVLLVPVGGSLGLAASQAAEVVNMLDPVIVVPLHERIGARPEADSLARFLKEMGIDAPNPAPSLHVTRALLPEERQVVVLAARA